MSKSKPGHRPSRLIAQLEECVRTFGPEAAATKQRLLQGLESAKRVPARSLASLHDCLCFLQAYPDNPKVKKAAESLVPRLRDWIALLPDAEETASLADLGFPGAVNRHPFSYAVLRKMAAWHPSCLEVEWEECEDEAPIQNALVLLTANNECQGLDDTRLTMSTWAEACKVDAEQSDLELLIRIFEGAPLRLEQRAYLYDSCALPTRYLLADPGTGRAEIRLDARRIHYHKKPLERTRVALERAIRHEFDSVQPLPRDEGKRLIHVALQALCARNLEIATLMYANPEDCFLLDGGKGLRVALIGVTPDMRDTLESSYFFLILKNELPIAYGPASLCMGCCEMGINLFPEYRGGEIRLIYAQFMRALHQVLGVQYFYLTSYGMGVGNPEAIRTGAFWFYRKLGFHAENPEVEALAKEEEAHMTADSRYRSDRKMLKRLSPTYAYFDISKGRCSRLDLGRIGLAQSRFIASAFDGDRPRAIRECSARIADFLGIVDLAQWPAQQRRALELYAPVLCMIPGLGSWNSRARKALLAIIRSKGSRTESDVDRLVLGHGLLCEGLRELAGQGG